WTRLGESLDNPFTTVGTRSVPQHGLVYHSSYWVHSVSYYWSYRTYGSVMAYDFYFNNSLACRRAVSVISAPVNMRAISSTRLRRSILTRLPSVLPPLTSFRTTRWASANLAI